MPSKNTLYARLNGYSDIKRMRSDDTRQPSMKNYGVRTGVTVDSQFERQKKGKNPYSPPTHNGGHWVDDKFERRIRKEFGRD
jgi:hypothetical protein